MVFVNEVDEVDLKVHEIKDRIRELASSGIKLKSDYSKASKPEVLQEQRRALPDESKAANSDEEDPEYQEAVSLISLHPGEVMFEDLLKDMKPIVVEGLENIKGLMGSLEKAKPGVGEDQSKSVNATEDDDEAHERVLPGSLVWVHYSMYYEKENTPFMSSSVTQRPKVLEASRTAVMDMMVLALRWTPVGCRARFIIPRAGLLGIIGEKASKPVLLLVHVIKWLDAGATARYCELDDNSKKDFDTVSPYVESTNQLAKHFFVRKKAKDAICLYQRSLEMLDTCEINTSNKKGAESLKVRALVNLAMCHERCTDYPMGLACLEKASMMEDHRRNCKALFLRGKLNFKMKEFAEAKEALTLALRLEPHNEEIGAELVRLDRRITGINTNDGISWTPQPPNLGRAEDLVEAYCSLQRDRAGPALLPGGYLDKEIEDLSRMFNKYAPELSVRYTKQGVQIGKS